MSIPRIVVASGEAFYLELLDHLPRSASTLVFADSIGEALGAAMGSDLVIVDTDLLGGGEDLCARLQADPLTANVPIILRAPRGYKSPSTDSVTQRDKFDETQKEISEVCPSISQDPSEGIASLDEDEESDRGFDVKESTQVWRRPDEGTNVDSPNAWPQPPPILSPAEDILEPTRNYSGYLNSLLEGHASLDSLSEGEKTRLFTYSAQVVANMNYIMEISQSAVNLSLKAGDLARMRELSEGRSVVYGQLRRLQIIVDNASVAAAESLAQSTQSKSSPLPVAGPTGPQPRRRGAGSSGRNNIPTASADPDLPPIKPTDSAENQTGATGPQLPPPTTESTASGLYSLSQKKSAITLAAEELERQRAVDRAAVRAARARQEKKRRVSGSARRVGKPQKKKRNYFWLWVAIMIAAIGVLVYVIVSPPSTSGPKEIPVANTPPEMLSVTLQQTPNAVIALPKSRDNENDRVAYIVRWTVDGTKILDVRTLRLPRKKYSMGSKVAAMVIPSDGKTEGVPMDSRPLKIENLKEKRD